MSIKKASIPLTARQLVKKAEKKEIVFDNAIQRAYVWDDARKSLLIHSMIVGYPIPPFFAKKADTGEYDCLDGKQRSNAIIDFLNGTLKLSQLPEIEMENSELFDISGMTFEQLPEDFKENITGYSLTLYYFEDITDEEVNELFFRLNNGKPLSAIELTRVKAKSIDQIKRIGQHDIFLDALTKKAINRYANEDIVIKSYAILFTENPSFETKKIRPIMEEANITDDQCDTIETAYTRIQEAYKAIKSMSIQDENERKMLDKVVKRILSRTHFITIVPIALDSINNNVSVEVFAQWLYHFYSGKKSATISDEYNASASAGSARSESVRARLEAAMDDYKAFVSEARRGHTDATTDTNEDPQEQIEL